MDDRLMTVNEVSGYLSMHKVTIYRLIKAGVIPAFKIGGQWRFKRDAIGAWIAAKTNSVKGDFLTNGQGEDFSHR